MFSSSAATSLVLDIYKQYGPDSQVGRMVSIIMSSTETIFYTMAVYFVAAGVKKTRYTLLGCLIATFTGVIASAILTNLMF
jgi:spore maturation protein B